ncbi:MAG: pyridoxal phosphate-dependent aminotransferase [Sedimentibacter sp.]
MKNVFSNRVFDLSGESAFEALAKAKALEAKGINVVHFEIGEPDFDTPKNIVNVGKKALDDGFTHYATAQGYIPLREAIVEYYKKYNNVDTNIDEVVVTPGGKPIIFYTFLALVNPGDEVIYPDPGFPIYKNLIKFLNAVPVPIKIKEENDFRLDVNELKSKITSKTKLIIINSPANPTGGVLTPDDINNIAEAAKGKGIYVLSDEIYDRIIYSGQIKSIASISEMKDWTVVLNGFSKTYAMTGWRLGYGIMNNELAKKMTDLMINSNSCVATFTQVAAVEALTGSQDAVTEMVEKFKNRRDIMIDGLNSIKGISCKKPKGAFYAFPNITATGKTSKQMADYLMDAGVSTLAGSGFGDAGEGYLRLSYANSEENIKIALERIENAVKSIN